MKPMLAKVYDGRDVSGWLMSEKLDGVRAVWTGSKFISRNGNEFQAPGWFKDAMPDTVLDGELRIGRGRFQETVGIIRSRSADWSEIAFQVFDAPLAHGRFWMRLMYVEKVLRGNSVAVPVKHTACRCRSHASRYCAGVCSLGGEGAILRDPDSLYVHRRSDSMLKLKPTDSDEAVVVGYESGTGRNSGRTGALVCRWKSKRIRLGAGLSDRGRGRPPEIGEFVTFQHNGLTDSGLPRHPIYVGSRDYE